MKFFNSDAVIKKMTHEKFGILLSKGRILDGKKFLETGELGDLNLGTLGVKVNTPVLYRFSPLSYCIAQHVDWNVSRHRGIETTIRCPWSRSPSSRGGTSTGRLLRSA